MSRQEYGGFLRRVLRPVPDVRKLKCTGGSKTSTRILSVPVVLPVGTGPVPNPRIKCFSHRKIATAVVLQSREQRFF